MFTVLSNTRNSNLYIITALAITLVVFLTLAVAPSIAAPQPAVIPVTGSQNAYLQFLSGEKVMYAEPAGLGEAISAYHAGEKTISVGAVDLSSALSTYRLGEKVMYANPNGLSEALSAYHLGEKAISANAVEWISALSTYRQGEKAIHANSADLGNALSTWRIGEKTIVQSNSLEAALSTWRQGEKELK